MASTEPTKHTLIPDLYVNVPAAKWFSASADVLRSVQGTFPRGPTEDQQFLHLGCGPGNITRQVLLPQCLPCRRLVAVDSSENMLKYARERFSHPKIFYDTLNIVSGDLSEFVGRYGLFDRVYGLPLLNWLKDQEQALKNIAKLMKPGGEAFFFFSASTPQIRFRKKLAGMPRWSKHAKICEDCTPPTVDLAGKEALVSYVTGILKNANWTMSMCDVISGSFEPHIDLEYLIQDLMATIPIRAFLTKEEESLLLQDAIEEANRLWAGKDSDASLLAFSTYKVRASKPEL